MKKYQVSFLFVFFGFVVFAQIPKNSIDVDISVFPKEITKLAINSEVLLAGEMLQYRIVALNEKNQKSSLSKIAYVSMRDKNDSVIFDHKLKLNNGSASSDFFLPANLETGKYYLIGYTNFSRNDTAEAFDGKQIYVINTFLENRSSLGSIDTISINKQNEEVDTLLINYKNAGLFHINTEKPVYGFREKVTLSVAPIDKFEGELLLSVRKLDPIKFSDPDSRISYNNDSNLFYIPELRGEILSGVVLSSTERVPIPNQEVSLTIPGKDFVFKIAKTDKHGRFFFSVEEDYNSEKSLIQIVEAGGKNKNYSILLDNKEFHLKGLESHFLKLDPQLRNWLRERSVQIQIENAYFEIKQDSLLPKISHSLFYDNLGTLYNLDDYTRFPTVKETFIEIVTLAAIRGLGENSQFMVYNEYDPKGIGKFKDVPPLVLMDGIIIQNNSELFNYNAREIKSIRVINIPYRYGPKLFNGIISVETINGDFWPFLQENYQEINLAPTVLRKEYFAPDYSNSTLLSRIPDHRVQLLWNPHFIPGPTGDKVSFFTSEVPGMYVVRLVGLSNMGDKIEMRQYFEVSEN